MKRVVLFLFLSLLLIIFCESVGVGMGEDIFEAEIKLYRGYEIKKLFPNLDITEDHMISQSYSYIFGWIRVKENAYMPGMFKKPVTGCRIKIWSKSFKREFYFDLGREKCYFLIPLGTMGTGRDIQYQISTP